MNTEVQQEYNSEEEVGAVDMQMEKPLEADASGAADDTWEEDQQSPLEDHSGDVSSESAAMHSENPESSAIGEAVQEAIDEEQDLQEITKEANVAASKRNAGRFRWYIVQAHTNFEKKVAAAIQQEAQLKGLTDMFEEVVVPTEEVVEVRRGRKVQSEKRFFPGYVLVKMQMNDATWQLVKSTDKVTGFLGGKGMRPQPITEAEAQAIFQQVEEGAESPRSTISYEIGEEVKVIDGPFDSFIGLVDGVDEEKQKLKVSVSIFGRSTPVELNFDQVQKV